MGRSYVAVEGHGDEQAIPNLLTRLSEDLALPSFVWGRPFRSRGLHHDQGVRRACEQVRLRGDADSLLVLRDADDECPAETAPSLAVVAQALQLPFPVAFVLACREYESLFLASLESVAGRELPGPGGHSRPGLNDGVTFLGDLERKRDVKGWLTSHMPAGRVYKPTVDQLPMTRMVDFDLVRRRGLAWFGTLERALTFLASNRGRGPGLVYPASVSVGGGRSGG